MHADAVPVRTMAAAPAAVVPARTVEIDGFAHQARRDPLLVFAERIPEGTQGGRDGGRALGTFVHHRAAPLEALHEVRGLALLAGRTLLEAGEALLGRGADRGLDRGPEPFLIGCELQAGLDRGDAGIDEAVEVVLAH